jgi:hypothetical protein
MKTEIVSLEMEIPKHEHPWQKFAGIYKDSYRLASVLSNIEANRRELNSQVCNDYEQEKIA